MCCQWLHRCDGTEVRLRLVLLFYVQFSCRVTGHPNLPRTEGVPRVRDFKKKKLEKSRANWEELVTLLQDPRLSLIMARLMEVSRGLAQPRQMLDLDESAGV